jgi:hypothetical protein
VTHFSAAGAPRESPAPSLRSGELAYRNRDLRSRRLPATLAVPQSSAGTGGGQTRMVFVRAGLGMRAPHPALARLRDDAGRAAASPPARPGSRGRPTHTFSTEGRPGSGAPRTGCSCHDPGGREHRTGREGPGDSLQRLAVYHGKGTKACPARSRKRGCRRSSAGLVRRAIQNYAAGYRSSREIAFGGLSSQGARGVRRVLSLEEDRRRRRGRP